MANITCIFCGWKGTGDGKAIVGRRVYKCHSSSCSVHGQMVCERCQSKLEGEYYKANPDKKPSFFQGIIETFTRRQTCWTCQTKGTEEVGIYHTLTSERATNVKTNAPRKKKASSKVATKCFRCGWEGKGDGDAILFARSLYKCMNPECEKHNLPICEKCIKDMYKEEIAKKKAAVPPKPPQPLKRNSTWLDDVLSDGEFNVNKDFEIPTNYKCRYCGIGHMKSIGSYKEA